jgi:hypothetical protein
MPSNVQLLLEGLIAVFAKEHSTNGIVGILKSPPVNHQLTITITKTAVTGSNPITFTIKDPLELLVSGASQTDITFRDRQASLDRTDPTKHKDSFSWAVDLENQELYKKPIGANKASLSPILTFNAGELFTDTISRDHLEILRGSDTNFQDFGFVAIKIGLVIALDKAGSQATFKSGGSPVFTVRDSDNALYEIDITHESPKPHPKVVTDANYYYTAVGSKLTGDDLIQFRSVDTSLLPLMARLKQAQLEKNPITEAAVEAILKLMTALGPPAGPEAACFPAVLTQSDPS